MTRLNKALSIIILFSIFLWALIEVTAQWADHTVEGVVYNDFGMSFALLWLVIIGSTLAIVAIVAKFRGRS